MPNNTNAHLTAVNCGFNGWLFDLDNDPIEHIVRSCFILLLSIHVYHISDLSVVGAAPIALMTLLGAVWQVTIRRRVEDTSIGDGFLQFERVSE